ncbi:MAG: hypothetical protein OXS29_08920 [bacterium]|nr:hypothetical protein [bacterium]MDE0287581.1 hypothetical protein [bacterium]MDE0440245.1 hypothetical protein [bacterium]
MKLLDPRAEEYRLLDGADPLKPVEAVELNVGILNSRWESMTRIAAIVDERLRRLPFIGGVKHWKIKHSEPTPEDVLDQVTGYSHFAVLGLGN